MRLGEGFYYIHQTYGTTLTDSQKADVRLGIYKQLIARHGPERVLRHAAQIAAALDSIIERALLDLSRQEEA